MGVDVRMSMGFGFHVPEKELDAYQERVDPEGDYGKYEILEETLPDTLTYSYAGNAWVGKDHGAVIYVKDGFRSFEMGREAEAGVYTAARPVWKYGTLQTLNETSWLILGRLAKVEYIVTIGIS